MHLPFHNHILVLLLALGCASPVLAWGAKGHRVIGALAEKRLTPAAHAAVNAILAGEDLATVSTWADDMRAASDKRAFWSDYAANWHYVNAEPDLNYAGSDKNPRGDAYVALETFAAILRGDPVPAGPVRDGLASYFDTLDVQNPEVRRFALKFLVHILGDLQQPLHSGYAADRGGNEVTVFWFGQRSNLHALWDSGLLEQQEQSYSDMAARLSDRISRTPAADIHSIESTLPQAWIDEAQTLLERIYARHAGNNQLSDAYAAEFSPIVEEQLVKGGLRTAFFLNKLFDG